MGAIADAMTQYAQPLINVCDGSPEDLQRAYSLSQLCWNAAIMPDENRAEFLAKMQPALNMDDEEFQDFMGGVVEPMIQRHHEMFPAMRRQAQMALSQSDATKSIPPPALRTRIVKKYPGTGRNERCPCGSGRKYKVCCGR